ncbi:hypothetical protein [Crossiella sp. CA198]|uniref:hypothetical protein n=1 Tax=Crossiella sp. CA198 TaxID=3455607 RepID=UPI003F8D6A80
MMRSRGWHAELIDPDSADPILLIDHDERFVRVPLNVVAGADLTDGAVDATLELWADLVPVSDPEAAEAAMPSVGWDFAGRPGWQLVVRRAQRWICWDTGPLTTTAIEGRLWSRALRRAAEQDVRLDGDRRCARLRCTPGPAAAAFAWPARLERAGAAGHAALVCGPDVVYLGEASLLRRLRSTELPYGILLRTAQLHAMSAHLRALAHGGR